MIEFQLNGAMVEVDVEDDTPLLWALRDTLKLTGTKFGCGMGLCGACTVHVSGVPVRACQTPLGSIAGKSVTTIEGIGGGALHPVQQAWIEFNVPQCGYCQSGMIMAVTAMLADRPAPTDDEIDRTITNICRCGTFVRIRRAIHAVARLREGSGEAGERSPEAKAAAAIQAEGR